MIGNTEGVKSFSDPLASAFEDHYNSVTLSRIQIKYWAHGDKEWLIVSSHKPDLFVPVPEVTSTHWILDLARTRETGKPFWFTPWTFPSCVTVVGHITGVVRSLAFGSWDASGFQFAIVDPTGEEYRDLGSREGSDYASFARTSLFRQPTGNHVNTLREPGMTSVVDRFIIERTKFTSDADPTVTYYLDDTGLTPVAVTAEAVSRRDPSQGYVTNEYHVNEVCQRFGFKVSQAASTQRFEVQDFAIIWKPESGA
jgi:hypothetical protein